MRPNNTKVSKIVAVSTKDNFRRPVPKTYSYRYEVAADAGPDGYPLVERGAAIIESRYRGRGASWQVSRSPVSKETYTVNGGYVHPLPENPMAYPPRAAESNAAPAPPPATPTPMPRTRVAEILTVRHDSGRTVAKPPAQLASPIRRGGERPTPANEPAYRKTG